MRKFSFLVLVLILVLSSCSSEIEVKYQETESEEGDWLLLSASFIIREHGEDTFESDIQYNGTEIVEDGSNIGFSFYACSTYEEAIADSGTNEKHIGSHNVIYLNGDINPGDIREFENSRAFSDSILEDLDHVCVLIDYELGGVTMHDFIVIEIEG